MTYDEIAEILIRESGRYDLQNADGSDNGLRRFVNSGQRMLDRKANILESSARSHYTVDIGDYYLKLPECRVVESVWLLDQRDGVNSERRPMTEIPWDSLQICYNKLASQQTKGTPTQYARGSFRSAPSNRLNIAETMNHFAGFDDTFAAQNFDQNAIFFGPSADFAYSFQVVGKFYSALFSTEVEETLWSQLHPEILIASARFWMEVANRNTEGRQDWELLIQGQLTDLDKDMVDQQTQADMVMGDPYETELHDYGTFRDS